MEGGSIFWGAISPRKSLELPSLLPAVSPSSPSFLQFYVHVAAWHNLPLVGDLSASCCCHMSHTIVNSNELSLCYSDFDTPITVYKD